jgi:hypothetical protein
MILKSETYYFHRLDLTRQAGFIVTIYGKDGLRLASTQPMPTPAGAQDRRQQNRRALVAQPAQLDMSSLLREAWGLRVFDIFQCAPVSRPLGEQADVQQT